MSLILYIVIGGALGGALGYFGKCSSGACPLTANWRRGAMIGIGISVALFFASGSGNSTAMNQSSANVRRIGAGEFEAEVILSPSPVLVEFYATWCGPCKVLSPRVEKIAAEFSGRVKIVKVNFDESQAIAERFGIYGIPTLVVFENGKVVDALLGLQSEADLRTHLQAAASQVSTVK